MKAFLNYRYYVLFALGAVAILGIFGVPDDNAPLFTWFYVLITSKFIGFFAGCWCYALLEKWRAAGKLRELEKFIDLDEEEDED